MITALTRTTVFGAAHLEENSKTIVHNTATLEARLQQNPSTTNDKSNKRYKKLLHNWKMYRYYII